MKYPVQNEIAIDGFPAMVIRLRYPVPLAGWVDFEIHEAFGVNESGVALWPLDEERMLDRYTTSLDEAHPDVTGFVKGDGCTQLSFDGESYQIHYDDIAGLARLMDAIKRAQAECYAILGIA